jgi:CRISPR-associated protein Cas2
MYILISYDIVSDRVRNKVMKLLKDYGDHVQKSVFECHLDDNKYAEVKNGLMSLVNPKEDRVRLYRICQACMGKIEISGWGTVKEEEEFTVV